MYTNPRQMDANPRQMDTNPRQMDTNGHLNSGRQMDTNKKKVQNGLGTSTKRK